jgi:hypothetical protein
MRAPSGSVRAMREDSSSRDIGTATTGGLITITGGTAIVTGISATIEIATATVITIATSASTGSPNN